MVKKVLHKALMCIISTMLVCGFVPMTAFAAAGVTVNNGSPTVVDMSAVAGDVVIKSDGLWVGPEHADNGLNSSGYEFKGDNSATEHTIKVERDVTVTLCFNNLSMNTTGRGNKPVNLFDCSHSKTTIVLKGKNKFRHLIAYGDDLSKAIGQGAIVKNGSKGELNITCENADKPNHKCDENCGSLDISALSQHTTVLGNNFLGNEKLAGAPVDPDDLIFSNLTIKGGNIKAAASPHMPAIGAACCWTDGGKLTNLTISGGIVDATGGENCAGIGSGAHGVPVYGMVISGNAQVVARGGLNAPGIGTGGGEPFLLTKPDYSLNSFTVTGGDARVTAYGDAASNMPGIGCGKDPKQANASRSVDATAIPLEGYRGYIKYGTSDKDYAYSAANPKTPFTGSEEFGKHLENLSKLGENVYYTQVHFSPHRDVDALDANTIIGGNDVVIKTGGAPFSKEEITKISNVIGRDENGKSLNVDEIVPDQADLDAINAAKQAGKVGNFKLKYSYSYKDPVTGEPKTLTIETTVHLREEGINPSDVLPTIGANNAVHITGGKAFTEEDVMHLCDVDADDSNGLNVIHTEDDGTLAYKGITIDQAQLKALNDAKTAGKTGSYDLTFTYEGKSVTVKVELRDFGTDNVKYGNPENGANKAKLKADGKEFTKQEVFDLTKPVAKDSNGNTIAPENITLNQDDLKALNDARKGYKAGVFPVNYTYMDIDNKTMVSFKGEIEIWTIEPTITAQDKTIKSDEAKTIPNKEGLAQYLKPAVTDENGNAANPTNVVVNDEDMNKIKAGTPGVYPVTYEYTYGGGTVSKKVNLTVVQTPVITAQDNTIKPDVAKNTISKKEDLAQYLTPAVVSESGKNVAPTDVKIDDANLEKIKAGTSGKYPVTYIYTYTDNTGEKPEEKKVETIAYLTITDTGSVTARDKTVLDTVAQGFAGKDDLKNVMGASALKNGQPAPVSDIVTEVADDVWNKIKAGTPGSYPVVFSYTPQGGDKASCTNTLTIHTTPKIEAKDATVNSTRARAELTDPTKLASVLDPKASDVLGQPATVSNVFVDPANMDKIKAGVEGVYPVTYKYTYTDNTLDVPQEKSVETTVQLTVTNSASITGKDKIILDTTAKGLADKSALVNLLSVQATADDGSNIPAKDIAVDVSEDIWNKIKAGVVGEYQVPFSYTDPSGKVVKTTQKLTIHTTPVIDAHDATVTSTTARTIASPGDLAPHLAPSATDVLGQPATPTEVFVDPANMDKIKAGVEGVYPVTYRYAYTDSTGDAPQKKMIEKTVQLTVTNATTIDATDKVVSSDKAKNIGENDLKKLMNLTATDDGNPVDNEKVKVTVDPEDMKKISAGTPGVYPVKFSYTDPSGKEVTVVRNLVVNGEPLISAENKMIASGNAHDMLTSPEELKNFFAPTAQDVLGNPDKVSDIEVSPEDMQNIAAGKPGVYPVTFTYKYTDKTGAAPEEKTVRKTVELEVTSVFGDPPVKKVISGDVPQVPSEFTFVFTAQDPANPMPEGSVNGVKEMSILGAGEVEFGIMEFTREGTYVYTVSEKVGNDSAYAYDKSIYTVSYEVTDNNGRLSVVRTINRDGEQVEAAQFDNVYTAPKPPVSPGEPGGSGKSRGIKSLGSVRTGDVATVLPWAIALLASGAGIVAATVFGRKKKGTHCKR